jgi:hypothetical protein
MDKDPTMTTLVLEHLIALDDMATVKTIADALKQPMPCVSATLTSLRHYKAVEAIEGDKRLWWFATPANDTRVRIVEERAPVDGKVYQSLRHRNTDLKGG